MCINSYLATPQVECHWVFFFTGVIIWNQPKQYTKAISDLNGLSDVLPAFLSYWDRCSMKTFFFFKNSTIFIRCYPKTQPDSTRRLPEGFKLPGFSCFHPVKIGKSLHPRSHPMGKPSQNPLVPFWTAFLVEGSREIDSLLVETSLPWKSKTKQRLIFSMIHVKVSLLPIYAKFGLWTLWVYVSEVQNKIDSYPSKLHLKQKNTNTTLPTTTVLVSQPPLEKVFRGSFHTTIFVLPKNLEDLEKNIYPAFHPFRKAYTIKNQSHGSLSAPTPVKTNMTLEIFPIFK